MLYWALLQIHNLGYLVIAEEGEGGGGPSWATGYLVVVVVSLLVMIVILSPSRRRDRPRDIEFSGTTWGRVVTGEEEKKKDEGLPPGVFAPSQLAQQKRK